MLFSRALLVAVLVAVSIWFDTLPFLFGKDSLKGTKLASHLRSVGTNGLSQYEAGLTISRLLGDPTGDPHDDTPPEEEGHGDDHVDEHVDDHGDDHGDDHAADDHAAGGHPSLFEALSAIHIEIGTYAVFIIIGFIIIMKQMLELLLKLTEDTPFAGMIGKIEEELMIVGTSSFIFKVVLNTTNFAENEWAYPLEFAEILVPLISFAYCGLGLILVLISLEQCFAWSRAHNLKTLELLDDYLNSTKSIFFRFIPFNKSIEQMEFRIFNTIFCSTFKIQKDAFLFDEYVTKVFQRYVQDLIEIRFTDWFYVAVLLCLNLGRVKLNLQFHSCDKHDVECHERRDVYIFSILGGFVLAFAVALLVASRRLELTILRQHGLTSHLQYAKYIQDEEANAHLHEEHHMDAHSLKTAASKAKETKAAKRTSILFGAATGNSGVAAELGGASAEDLAKLGRQTSSDKFRLKPLASTSSHSMKIFPISTPQSASQSPKHGSAKPSFAGLFALKKSGDSKSGDAHEEGHAMGVPVGASASIDEMGFEGTAGKGESIGGDRLSPMRPTSGGFHTAERSPRGQGGQGIRVSTGSGAQPSPSPSLQPSPMKTRPIRTSMLKRSLSLRTGQEVFMLGQQSEVIVNVFWFHNPDLYFECVEMMFMVIAFYIALWLTVMVSEAPTNAWKIISILPAIVICCFFFQIVKTAALLRAIYEVDSDALLEVIEETEAAKQLSDELRDKVIAYLNCDGEEAYAQLERFYKIIDANGNNALSRSEFGQFMSLMQITFSAKKWERIFKEIDRNYDNDISLQEFYLFLFPNHDLALKMEMRRLKVISQRVMSKANKVLASLSPFFEVKLISSPSKASMTSRMTSDLGISLRAVSKFRRSVKHTREAAGAAAGAVADGAGKFVAAAQAAASAASSPKKTTTTTVPTATSAFEMPAASSDKAGQGESPAREPPSPEKKERDEDQMDAEQGQKDVRLFTAESPLALPNEETAPQPTYSPKAAQRYEPELHHQDGQDHDSREDGLERGVAFFQDAGDDGPVEGMQAREEAHSPSLPRAWSQDSGGPHAALDEPSQILLGEEDGGMFAGGFGDYGAFGDEDEDEVGQLGIADEAAPDEVAAPEE